jgi:hypothetical protein
MKKLVFFIFVSLEVVSLNGQDTLVNKKTNVLNTQTLLSVKTENQPADSTQFKTPKYKQGFFCNFEDQLNRKKVPIDFSLGKSKY